MVGGGLHSCTLLFEIQAAAAAAAAEPQINLLYCPLERKLAKAGSIHSDFQVLESPD